MAANKIVFCDTGFMIRLLDATNELHSNALGYFRYFLNEGLYNSDEYNCSGRVLCEGGN